MTARCANELCGKSLTVRFDDRGNRITDDDVPRYCCDHCATQGPAYDRAKPILAKLSAEGVSYRDAWDAVCEGEVRWGAISEANARRALEWRQPGQKQKQATQAAASGRKSKRSLLRRRRGN